MMNGVCVRADAIHLPAYVSASGPHRWGLARAGTGSGSWLEASGHNSMMYGAGLGWKPLGDLDQANGRRATACQPVKRRSTGITRSESNVHSNKKLGIVSLPCPARPDPTQPYPTLPYSLLSTLYSVLSTLYSLLSTLYSLRSTLYSLYSLLSFPTMSNEPILLSRPNAAYLILYVIVMPTIQYS